MQKPQSATQKIDDLKNKPENRKCFDCREKVLSLKQLTLDICLRELLTQ
jgi:hypothetical protein